MAAFSTLKGLKAIEGPPAQEEAGRTFEETVWRKGRACPAQTASTEVC